MARTIVGVNDAKAVKRYAGLLAFDTSQQAYWGGRFTGRGAESETPVQALTDLESDSGEQIAYDLLAELRMAPVEGDDVLENREENQRHYTDTIYIDQARAGVNTGGRMTRKRTLHDLRAQALRQQRNWWARFLDELHFVYGTGKRGVNDNFLLPLGYTGRANNALTAADSDHTIYGGNATAFNNIDSADTFSLRIVDRCVTRAATQGGGASDIPVMQPCKIGGEECFVMVMHTYQEDDMRTNTDTGQWLDIQKAAAGAEGRNSPLFKSSLGMYRKTILHSHRNVILDNTAGAGANVEAAHALFLGAQGMVVAWGSPGTNMRFDWNEETRDNGNQVVISTSGVFGIKKVRWNMNGAYQDFGIYNCPTAAASR